MINGKTIKAIIPARMTSTRLPGKVMKDICGKPALQRVIERVKSSKLIDGVVIATTINKQDDCIEEFCKSIDCECTRGSENDVLDRTVKSAKESGTDIIINVTSDCPLIDYNHIDTLISMHMKNNVDLTTNILKRTFPIGYDLRIVDTKTLEKVQLEVDNDIDRQHVYTWMYLNPKSKKNYKVQNLEAPNGQNRPDIEVTLDTQEDYELLQKIFAMGEDYKLELNCQDVINLINTYPHICQQVKEIKRKDYFQELKKARKDKPKEQKRSDATQNGNSSKKGRPRKKV